MAKKRTWKFWVSRSLLLLLLVLGVFLVNLIWFKPFKIRHFYDKVFLELAIQNPEIVSYLGIPVLYDRTKDELTDVSDANLWKEFEQLKGNYETLKSYDFDKQSKSNQLNTKILNAFMEIQLEGESYFYHDYPVNQMFGVQNELPSFMESAHKLEDKSDMEAYIARLSKFDTKFEQVLEGLKIREDKGIIPPKFVIKRVLDEMNGFIGNEVDSTGNITPKSEPVKSNILYVNFEQKTDSLDNVSAEEKEQLRADVAKEIEQTVFPTYQKLIDYFGELDNKATTDEGVWKLPDGANFYRYCLKSQTTTSLNPDEVHKIGLAEVDRIKGEMSDILVSQGYKDTGKTLGEQINELNKEERFLFPNNDEGREMILAEYNRILDEISAGIDDAFDIRPKAELDIKRVPEFKEEGSAGAYYSGPAMDGSRGGVFYANLRNVHETLKFGMKTLAYHEGIPGHHFQIAIQSELKGVPIFRTILPFTAYAEGWALYTEQLAWELGFYDGDPFGNLGRLQAEMFRAVRLVVDTGIHAKKWTREQAIDYMVENTGMNRSEVTTEVERYIVMPGQACAYKIGMMKILELRERTKQALGEQFDLKEFHNVVLKNGSVPLDILEQLVDEYIDEYKQS